MSASRSVEDIQNDIRIAEKKLEQLGEERSKILSKSYSQSDPGAMMDRRWIQREYDSHERKLEKLKSELKNSS
jgi:proline dehydrogenase